MYVKGKNCKYHLDYGLYTASYWSFLIGFDILFNLVFLMKDVENIFQLKFEDITNYHQALHKFVTKLSITTKLQRQLKKSWQHQLQTIDFFLLQSIT